MEEEHSTGVSCSHPREQGSKTQRCLTPHAATEDVPARLTTPPQSRGGSYDSISSLSAPGPLWSPPVLWTGHSLSLPGMTPSLAHISQQSWEEPQLWQKAQLVWEDHELPPLESPLPRLRPGIRVTGWCLTALVPTETLGPAWGKCFPPSLTAPA